jgi:hypothetical protein
VIDDQRAAADRAEDAFLGLYPRASFRIALGRDAGEATIRQARWYFADEIVALPADDARVAGFARDTGVARDLRRWACDRAGDAQLEHPPLVWIAAPDVMRHARLVDDGASIVVGAERIALSLAPRHRLNRSYFDASSARFFAQRELRLRGTRQADRFVARTWWPEDFALPAHPPTRALDPALSPALALRSLVRGAPQGGARAPFDTWTLCERRGSRGFRDGYALALVLTGAQGDDDEAHAGHFALATGRLAVDGAIGDWIVDNFYTLDSESEKGILGAPVPLDNYLGDLNAGQAWYRPTAMLVGALRDARAAALVQGAMNRVYNHFYRHQLHYDHASMNCTGISVDTLRTLGLHVPARKPAWRALAPVAMPWLLACERSIERARRAYDYATEDATRLLPAAAFEEIGAELVAIATGAARPSGLLASMLADDLEAVAFVRMPQLPSSRAWGDAPVVSLGEYRARLPKRRADMQVVPVPPRPLPRELRDDDVRRGRWRRSTWALAAWAVIALAALAMALA